MQSVGKRVAAADCAAALVCCASFVLRALRVFFALSVRVWSVKLSK